MLRPRTARPYARPRQRRSSRRSNRSTDRTCSSSRRRATYRMRYVAVAARVRTPEYPPVGARIDYYLASPSGEVKLDILDAAGTVVRSFSSERRAAAGGTRRRPPRRRVAVDAADQDRHEPLRLGSALSRRAAERAAATWKAAASAAAGRWSRRARIKARLTAGGVTKTETLHREDRSARREGRRHGRRPGRADEVRAEGARRARRGAAAVAARAARRSKPSAAIRRSCRACGSACHQERPVRRSDVHRSAGERRAARSGRPTRKSARAPTSASTI